MSTTGLDQYLSAKKTIPYEQQDLYFRITDLFGSFWTEPEAKIEFYISNWKFDRDREIDKAGNIQYRGIVEMFGLERFVTDESPSGAVVFDKERRSIDVRLNVAYWRKANQIHSWFVENVQDGVDECEPHEVSREQLQTLVDLCKQVLLKMQVEEGAVHTATVWKAGENEPQEEYREGTVIANPEIAQEMLPTARGFFFGGTDYDEGYIYDLDQTITQLERALEIPDGWTFVYQSSW